MDKQKTSSSSKCKANEEIMGISPTSRLYKSCEKHRSDSAEGSSVHVAATSLSTGENTATFIENNKGMKRKVLQTSDSEKPNKKSRSESYSMRNGSNSEEQENEENRM